VKKEDMEVLLYVAVLWIAALIYYR